MAIDLNYRVNTELFDKVASEWATKIGSGRGGVKNTQIRKFYDYVLEYAEKAKRVDKSEFTSEILPFIKMLNSKVAYASTRTSGGDKIVNDAFVQMIQECVQAVKEQDDLNNFKLFFEAVIGFHKGQESQGSKK
jgi:CRISPR-associated protein Csm2